MHHLREGKEAEGTSRRKQLLNLKSIWINKKISEVVIQKSSPINVNGVIEKLF